MMSYFHEEFSGWFPSDPFPTNKKEETVWENYLTKKQKIEFFQLRPMHIIVIVNVAVIQYFELTARTDPQKKEMKESKRQWTETWVKQGGAWKLLATHGTKLE